MANHANASAVIGTTPAEGSTALDFHRFSEMCWGCLLDDKGTGPCKLNKGTATLQQLTPGTLVHVEAEPHPGNLPTGTGIVVEPFGPAASASMVVVWMWADGQPIPGRNAFAYFPHEITPLRNTLADLPPRTFNGLAELARQAAHLRGFLELAAAVEDARTHRF
ncbi:hypothetical protein IHE61_31060 [Streptomyces sp. GKU 257-1]|nr:hypothetical protein [Streptomyces sp. GKU 257-1]